ncbi:MAG: hypothetical protein K0Q72_320 [Armatimonadetes bacterium]|jgi:hypothetical protein|nr:hypothetical protein [Armatimonadota bacterium]
MPTTLRLLFIGNSFTQRNDLPGLLASLAAAGDPPVIIESERVLVNGASLRLHWNAGTALKLIEQRGWDAVVLQEQSTLPIKNRKRYHENVRLFEEAIRRTGSRIILYQTWARRHAPETQIDLIEASEAIAAELGAEVVPVGRTWEQVLTLDSPPDLYDKDGSHPSAGGSFLAACTFYSALTGRSAEGLPAPTRFAADTAAQLARIAHEVVSARSGSRPID